MKILFWVPYPIEGASNRYRVEQYLPYLKQAGIEWVMRPFWNRQAFRILYKKGYYLEKIFYFLLGSLCRFFDLLTVFKYDRVFIHREAYPVGGAFLESFLHALGKDYVYDFDDAIFLPDSSGANNFIERFKSPAKISKVIKNSKHVIVGNSYLAGYAIRYNQAVTVIPTSVDTFKFSPSHRKENREVVIGWMGSITTLNFLYPMQEVFKRISSSFPKVRFKIVGGSFSVEGLNNIESKAWSINEEIDDLNSFDIGIMPMPDDPWTRGKCGFKAILYMSMGIPSVCSAVGVNKEIITDSVNGYLADTNDKWIEMLSLLINSVELRRKIGLSGRRTVEERYSLQVNAPKFLKILTQTNMDIQGVQDV